MRIWNRAFLAEVAQRGLHFFPLQPEPASFALATAPANAPERTPPWHLPPGA